MCHTTTNPGWFLYTGRHLSICNGNGISLAGGGAGVPRDAATSATLAQIHKFPSMLLWLKLGGIGHILLGIFVALAAIVRALALMPHRLSYEMERTQG